MEALPILAIVIVVGIVLLSLFFYFVPVGLWVTAYFSGVRVRIFGDLVGMRLRKIPPARIVRPMISATKAGLEVSAEKLEAHYLAGGNVEAVVIALISAGYCPERINRQKARAPNMSS